MSDLIERARTAIEMAELQREIHEQWLEYVEANPNYTEVAVARKGDAGSAEHHKKCIARYDHMIAVIEEFIAGG